MRRADGGRCQKCTVPDSLPPLISSAGPDDFGEIVVHNCNRPVRLYVYNAGTEDVREVLITPDRMWGGEGCLGCGVGAGYLHALPHRRRPHKQKESSLIADSSANAPEQTPLSPPPQLQPQSPAKLGAANVPAPPEGIQVAAAAAAAAAEAREDSKEGVEPVSTIPTSVWGAAKSDDAIFLEGAIEGGESA